MALLVLGFVMLITGAITLRHKDLAKGLAREDESTWRRLGKPGGYGFFDAGATIALHSWIMVRGYEKCAKRYIRELGEQARTRALIAQYTMLCGIGMIVAGFALAIIGARPY